MDQDRNKPTPTLSDEDIEFYDPFEALFTAPNAKNEFQQSLEEAARVPGSSYSG